MAIFISTFTIINKYLYKYLHKLPINFNYYILVINLLLFRNGKEKTVEIKQLYTVISAKLIVMSKRKFTAKSGPCRF